jgi:hypothetical protein
MKKALLFGSLLLGATSSFAQLPTETFNSGLPATWTMVKVDNNIPNSGFSAPIPTVLASQAWMTRLNNTGDSAMLTVSWFTSPAKADRWLITPAFMVTDPKMIIQWLDIESISGGHDSLQVWVSPTAGTSVASFTTKIYDAAASPYATNPSSGLLVFGTHGASLGAYNGQSIRIAFRDNSTDAGAIRLDNVGTTVMANLVDGAANSITFPKIVDKTSSTPVVVTVSNQAATTITSMQVNYVLDAGTPVSQTFTGLNIAPFGTQNLTFSTNIVNPTVGQHSLAMNVIQVNGAADPIGSNNTKTVNFAVATGSTTRGGLIEEFSSSTCAPCASFNQTFDPLVNTNNPNNGTSGFNIVKYQMNWPNPGTDPSYNASIGGVRRGYYSVNAIPDHFTNGAQGGNGDQAEITASKATTAYMTISNVTYFIKKDSLIATATVTPNFTITGGNYKVHMAGAEEHYFYNGAAATVGQYNFYHIMRNMLNAGAGQAVTSWTAGTPQTFRWAHQWQVGTVAQGSTTYWSHPYGDGELIVWVQDESDKSVLQSSATKASWPAGVTPLSQAISQAGVYPNPATDHTTIAFKLESNASVNMQVIDALGRVAYSVPEQKMNAGAQMFVIPTTSFAAGLYTIKVQADGSSITERFSVAK